MIWLLKQLSVLFGWNRRLFLFVNLQLLNLCPFVKQKYFLFSCYFVRRIDTQWNRQCIMLYHHINIHVLTLVQPLLYHCIGSIHDLNGMALIAVM